MSLRILQSVILLFRNLHLTPNLYKPQYHSKKKQHAPHYHILGLWTLCLFCVLQNSGRSISGILARPLPKVSFCCLSLAQPTIEGSPAPNLSAFAITSANNPSVTVPKKLVLFCTSLTWNLKNYWKCCTALILAHLYARSYIVILLYKQTF